MAESPGMGKLVAEIEDAIVRAEKAEADLEKQKAVTEAYIGLYDSAKAEVARLRERIAELERDLNEYLAELSTDQGRARMKDYGKRGMITGHGKAVTETYIRLYDSASADQGGQYTCSDCGAIEGYVHSAMCAHRPRQRVKRPDQGGQDGC